MKNNRLMKGAALAVILVCGMTSMVLAGSGTSIEHAKKMDGKIYYATGIKATTDPPGVIIGARAEDPIPGNMGKILNTPRLIVPVTRKDAAAVKNIVQGTRFKTSFSKAPLDGLDTDASYLVLKIVN